MIDRHHGWNKSFKPLFIGLTLSFILMVAAFRMDVHHHLGPVALMWALLGLAFAQVLFQFIFYFHLGLEEKPAWGTFSVYFVIAVLIIIIGGSIWIMTNLNYNTLEGIPVVGT